MAGFTAQSFLPGGQIIVKSLARIMAPGPPPVRSKEKIAGDSGATATVIAELVLVRVPDWTSIWIVALLTPANSVGNSASICAGVALSNGAATPFTKMRAPARRVGSGGRAAVALVPS